MKPVGRLNTVFFLLLATGPPAIEAGVAARPTAVSPGGLDQVRLVEGACPTFSWGSLDAPDSYELVVYRLAENGGLALGESAELALRQALPGGSFGWTPSLESCLTAGADYAWSLRAVTGETMSEWSAPRLFRVRAGRSLTEVEEALAVIVEYLAQTGRKTSQLERVDRAQSATSSSADAPGELHFAGQLAATLSTAIAAIHGEMPDTSGNTAGVVGVTNSPVGTGLIGANLDAGGGADLLLDGSVQGVSDTVLTQSGIDRASVGVETFDIGNSGAGSLALSVDGVAVVTTATDQDTVGALSCADGEVPVSDGLGSWTCGSTEDADTLDTLDSTQFLRSDASDSFTSGTLTIAGAATLNVDGTLDLGGLSGTDDDAVFFDLGAVESLLWDDAQSRFELSDELAISEVLLAGSTMAAPVGYNRFGSATASPHGSSFVSGSWDLLVSDDLEVKDTIVVGGDLYVSGPSGTDDDLVYFDQATLESLRWNDAQSRFEFSDELAIRGVLLAGSTLAAPVPYHRFGNSTASPSYGSFHVETNMDLLVSDDLEAGGTILAGGDLFVSGTSGTDDDAIYFDQSNLESLRWVDARSRFEFSDELALSGVLQVSSLASAPLSYNRLGTLAATADELDSSSDLLISEDLEVKGNALFNGLVGIGTFDPDQKLHVVHNSTPVIIDRAGRGNDGALIRFRRDGAEQGSITVNSGTVSYNNFTGSHAAWSRDSLERGMLVTLTGDNRRLRGDSEAEIVYGVAVSQWANDPAVLGAYLGPTESGDPFSLDNPHLVTASGNGEVWVVDTGVDIRPGDYLISSQIPGHAMVDSRSEPQSHIIGRAGEGIKWSGVEPALNGIKHKRISVLFSAFVKDNRR